MKRLLKILAKAVIFLVILVIVAAGCLVLFVNPNRFKPAITAQVMKYTGRQLTIDGNLSWTFFPNMGVKVEHLVLNNPANFSEKTFAEIDKAIVSVKVLPLLASKVESNTIILDGVKLNLIKNVNGQNNWTFNSSAEAQQDAVNDAKEQASLKTASMIIAISGIDISNAEVNWIDEQTKQRSSIKNFSLQASKINVIHPFPVSVKFDFTNHDPVVSGHAEFSSTVSLNAAEQIYSFRNVDLSANIKQADANYKTTITGDVIADIKQQTLQWTDIKAVLSNLVMTGNVTVTNLDTTPRIAGQMQIQSFDLKQWLQNMGKDTSNIQALKNAGGTLSINSVANNLNVQGNLKLDEVQVNKVRMTEVVVPLRYQNKVVTFSPVTANLYQGTMQTQMTVNLTGAIPQISVQGKLSNVQTGLLLQDLGGADRKLKFRGAGNVDFQVTTAGSNSDVILKHLNGSGRFYVNNGALQGVDIAYMLAMASSFSGGNAGSATNSGETAFNTMSGTVTINNGVINNNDLLMDSASFTTKGNGDINLVNESIDYRLQTNIKQINQKDNLLNLYGLAIPISITGNLSNPSVRLDKVVLAKEIAEKQLEKAAGKVGDQLQKNLPEAGKLLQNLLGH